MDANPRLLALTRALADPLRLAVLHRLMTGPATVSELMAVVGAEQSRLSNHLALLRERRLVRTTRQGRHVIYELHDAAVGTLVEALGQIGGAAPRTVKSVAIAHARTCYDHLAGRLGVAMFKALVDRRAVKHQKDVPGDVSWVRRRPRCSKLSGWTSTWSRASAAVLPPRASTGPSASPTSAALSAPPSGPSCSRADGSCGVPAPARWFSPPRAGVVSGERSASPSSDRQCSSPRTICALWWSIFSTSSAGRIDSCR